LKKYIKEIIIATVLIFVATNIIGYYRGSSVKVAPNYSMLLEEKTVNGLNVKDILKSKKPLVINFWGTWCPVCNQEVSTLSKLANRDDIILLTIAVNSGANSDIKEYMQKKDTEFLVINDNNSKLAKSFNISVFPTTVFLSSDRKNIIKDSGYTTLAGFLARVKLVEFKYEE